MKKIWKRVCTGLLALITILTALPITSVQAAETQYWTESSERVGYIEHVMNDGTIHSTFNEGHMRVEGETAYCVDINTGFKNGYKTRHDASASMSAAQIEDVALSLEYVKQYRGSHSNLNANQGYLLEQCVVWQRLSEQLGWKCDNVRAAYSEISQDIQNEVYAGARAFVQANKGRYKCGGYIYTGEGQDLGQFWAELNVGNAKVKKTTANEIVTNGNAMYTIAGATFGIFSDQNCSNQIGTLTTNENGETNEVEVTAWTVYIKELSAPKGYKLDTTVHSLKVEAGKTVTLNVSDVPKVTETLVDLFKIDMETGKATAQGNAALAGDSTEQIKGMYLTQITEDGELAVLSGSNQYSVSDQVIRGGVKIQKRDLETKDTKAQGSATLKDAAFAIISLNENPVLVEGKLYKKNETVKTIQTGIDGVATTSADLLPYGKYKLEETKAPEGYLTDGAKAIEFSITENGKIVDLTDESHSIYNQIKRGDLEGVKIGAGTHKRLANVPFKITSKTTGESHIVVSDKNGQFSTASDWASHKKNTNAGKSSEDGIWFGTSEPDDSKGALFYDTYEIEELACESNKNMKLIPAFEVVVSRNKVTIDLGTLTDEYEKEITIHTTATYKKTGEKVIVAGKKVTIVDTVTLDGLEEGRKYQLKGWQMLKEENAELLIDGKRVESDYTFVADSEKMKVEISYTFDASELGGQNLVTFEELYDLKNPEELVKVAEHKDIDDEGQTVLITERKISIHTTATDKNGKKEVEAGKDLTIVDTVTLEGLEIGTNYKLSGWQMVKAENAKLLIDGKEVTNDYEFTADKENMEVQIEFTFNGSTLGGKQLVTFEELYDMTNPEEPKKVTEHKDINDEGQTVTIKEVPETPTPETPGTTTKTSNPPKTGDTANAILWIAILVLSAAGITGVRIWNKKKQVKRLGIEEKKEEEE